MIRLVSPCLSAGLALLCAAPGLAQTAPASVMPSPAATAPATAPATATTTALRERLPEDELIYFLLPDRFENGDPGNDRGGLRGGAMQTGFDPAHKGFFHGGDIAGLIRRLDYIQGMGATAIWVAPIFRNKPVQGGPGQESAGYHGYWVTDFTRVDPHFGSEAEFRALVAAAHARGMKVYMDIITNHTADVIQLRECGAGPCAYRSIADYPAAAYTPVVPAAERRVKVPAWLNDPAFYHNRGDSTFRGESSTMGDFVGLDDLATEDPRVVQGFIDIYGSWIDRFGIDGFRIDTAQHVNPEFWQVFAPAMTARAQARGIPNFHIFGEVATGDVDIVRQARWTVVAGLPSVLDFAFRRAVIDAVAGAAPTESLAHLFAGDVLYAGGEATARRLPTFLGNHDFGRFGHAIDAANPAASEGERLARATLAHAMLLTLRGVPTIYSGDEQGFTGDGGDQDAREDMFASRVATYNDNRAIGSAATTATANFDTAHPLYRAIASLAAVRARTPALRRGAQVVRAVSDGPGLFAVARIDPDSGREVLLLFNTSAQPIAGNVVVAAGSARFIALSGQCPAARRLPGSAAYALPAFGFAICEGAP